MENSEKVEFSSIELHGYANTVESKTLLEDLLETIQRVLHKRITILQKDYHDKSLRMCQGAQAQLNQYLKENPKADGPALTESVNDELGKQMNLLREREYSPARAAVYYHIMQMEDEAKEYYRNVMRRPAA